ncbi:hypothetical protein ABT136_32170, partial [Streptomyces sp. NPDC001856]
HGLARQQQHRRIHLPPAGVGAVPGAGRGAGVAVLTDLGSAVLTVKALLAEGGELPDGTRLVDAPFVEGAVAAVVTAATGAGLDAVEAAAVDAYTYRKA